MFKIEELSGSLIRSGRFRDAIPQVTTELRMALKSGVITEQEIFGRDGLINRFGKVLLMPSDFDEVQKLGTHMLNLAMRVPGMLETTPKGDFEKNVKASRETR